MSFKWTKFLEIAEEFAQREEEEYLRSAVSRAYYALYHILCNAAEQYGKGRKESHQELINTLKNLEKNIELKQGFKDLEDYEIRIIGNTLESLRADRNAADYDGASKISKKIAQDACEKVREIFFKISL